MGKKDLVQLLAGFVLVSVMVVIAVLFPVYGVFEKQMTDGLTYIRRPIWDAPNLYHLPQKELSGQEDRRGSSPDSGLESDDPGLPRVTPPNAKARPIFIDSMRGSIFNRKNLLGTLTAYLVIAYLAFAVWKWGWRG